MKKTNVRISKRQKEWMSENSIPDEMDNRNSQWLKKEYKENDKNS